MDDLATVARLRENAALLLARVLNPNRVWKLDLHALVVYTYALVLVEQVVHIIVVENDKRLRDVGIDVLSRNHLVVVDAARVDVVLVEHLVEETSLVEIGRGH